MTQRTLFDRPQARTEFADTCSTKGMKGETPIARKSDPQTSHEAAEKTDSTRTDLQDKCLQVWKSCRCEMTVKEIAQIVMDSFFFGIARTDDRYPTQLDNCRKRANEVANMHCEEVQGVKRNGCRLWKLKGSK